MLSFAATTTPTATKYSRLDTGRDIATVTTMPNYTITATSLARQLGCHPSHVRNIAARLRLGIMINPRLRMLSASDARKIRAAIRKVAAE